MISVADLFARSRIGKKLGPHGFDYIFLVVYLVAISTFVSRHMLLANALALALGLAFCGPRFAASVCVWAAGAFLSLWFKWPLIAAIGVLWLVLFIVRRRELRKTSE